MQQVATLYNRGFESLPTFQFLRKKKMYRVVDKKKQIFLVELTLDEDLCGESILEHCDPVDYIEIRELTIKQLREISDKYDIKFIS